MSALVPRVEGIDKLADALLSLARETARAGFERKHDLQIRDAAGKAWDAAVQATDNALRAHGFTPSPGREGHRERHEFLEKVGRPDLQKQYSFFSDRLHGTCFFEGAIPTEAQMNGWFDEVGAYIAAVRGPL